ncbi:3-hydroxyacyl-CoA dehydrogenase NAD-binding domain-containing protein (plasmid) [Aureimonas ureilytica]|uniref:3-hydroxyacyl-CoA dehydrogenase NAD-binding domain-containing protein n=1 Tax=Aureimonas ureilytica TaxID=401562 RepID=UPI003CF80CF7
MALVTIEVRDGIAFVTIDNPPVNAIGQGVRAGLMEAAQTVAGLSGVRAVVLSGAGRSFVSGSDIRELGRQTEPFLPEVLLRIEASDVPWVAALKGVTLGGGLELAMACHARVAAPGTRLGLPEVTLGIVPGAGGTVRLPRLVPLAQALVLVTTGKPIDAARALEIGLVDRMGEDDPLRAAEALARELADAGTPRRLADEPVRGDDIDWAGERARLAARSRGQLSPVEALDALQESAALPFGPALKRERERFLRLAGGAEARALRHVFFSEREAGRSLRETGGEPVDLSHVGVVGGGTMGAGIATALLLSGSSVCLVERDEAAAETARARVAEALAASAARGLLTPEARDAALARLDATSDFARLSRAALVIEAVFETMEVKREVFGRLDAVMPASAILATNTSYLDVDALAAGTRDPSRVLGLHFFSPAHVMKLLEVVRGKATSPAALATGGALARRLRKTAVVAGVCDGFVGNRIMAAYRRDCEAMLLEGASPSEVDAAMRDFGFAMGLFEVQDMSGLDIAWARRKAKRAADPSAPSEAPISDRLCEAGRLGRKAGRGWYDYDTGQAKPAPEVLLVIEEESAKAGIRRRDFAREEIMARILSTMQREGRAILDEGIADSAGDIDVVMIAGYGFPRHRGGPMHLLAEARVPEPA